MILPNKYLPQDRALIGVGADVLAALEQPMTVSSLWERTKAAREARDPDTLIPFDWFVLALCFLNAISAIESVDGMIVRSRANR